MKRDPKEAMERYQSQGKVQIFLQEFGKVMSGHFESLASQEEEKADQKKKEKKETKKEEVITLGPLHSQILEKKNRYRNSNVLLSFYFEFNCFLALRAVKKERRVGEQWNLWRKWTSRWRIF